MMILSAILTVTCQNRITYEDEVWLLNSNIIQGRLTEQLRELLDDVTVQRTLLNIAYKPRDRECLESELEGTGVTLEHLVSSGLVRLEMDRYIINYLLFTKEDMLTMREITNKHAQYLADAILDHSSELEAIMEQYKLEGVDRKAVLFIILACFSLDWDGLVISADRSYRIPNRGKDERIILWSWEPCDLLKKGFYKGSHNSTYGSVTFTSFGDHDIQPREALPDILWGIPRNATNKHYSEDINRGIKSFMETSMVEAGEQLGLMMMELRSGAKSWEELAEFVGAEREVTKAYLDFLTTIGYIEATEECYRAHIPVLTIEDSHIVTDVFKIGHEELVNYFDTHYEKLKEELSSLTPFRHGVDLSDYFYEVWHDIFGAANLILVKEGLFPNPYSERYGAKGIIPAVYDSAYYTIF